MKFYTQDQMVDKHVGVKGTPARAEYDEQVDDTCFLENQPER